MGGRSLSCNEQVERGHALGCTLHSAIGGLDGLTSGFSREGTAIDSLSVTTDTQERGLVTTSRAPQQRISFFFLVRGSALNLTSPATWSLIQPGGSRAHGQTGNWTHIGTCRLWPVTEVGLGATRLTDDESERDY